MVFLLNFNSVCVGGRQVNFLLVLDYGHILYMCVSKSALKSLDFFSQSALRFITCQKLYYLHFQYEYGYTGALLSVRQFLVNFPSYQTEVLQTKSTTSVSSEFGRMLFSYST